MHVGTAFSQSQGVIPCRLSMPHLGAGKATHYGLLFLISRVAESLSRSLFLLFLFGSPSHHQGYQTNLHRWSIFLVFSFPKAAFKLKPLKLFYKHTAFRTKSLKVLKSGYAKEKSIF